MDFLDITSLGTAYRYAAKIEQKFKQKKRDFGFVNPKPGKGAPEPQNKGKGQSGVTQNNTTNPNKDTGKWCEFHNSPTHSTNECQTKQSLVAELKAPESDTFSNPESEPDKGKEKWKQIIGQILVPLLPPPRYRGRIQRTQRRGSASSVRRCG